MREIENLKQQIIKDFPRLDEQSFFGFCCRLDLPCFNKCCRDVNIFLTPYDIIRLKNRLGITSTELLSKYTASPIDQNLPYPVIVLRMNPKDDKKCPFVTEKGCGVYEDRPWACRLYPLGLAAPSEETQELDEEFYFLLKEDFCKGFGENHRRTVADWLQDQGIKEYRQMGEAFGDLTTHKFFRDGGHLAPDRVEMFFMACYDIDRFRKVVFSSSLLDKFEVDEATQAHIKEDDLEMMAFAYQWLRFSLFGESGLTKRGSSIEDQEQPPIPRE